MEQGRRLPFRTAPQWLFAEVRPHADELTLSVTGRKVTATIRQHGHDLPLAYPMSADWSGSPNLHIGDADDARLWHAATFDPVTGELKPLRRGTVALAVTVNGVRKQVAVNL